ncbi:hypothetical protein [Candidatus Poriferisocius sp.]|uniref:hypothetical protein n=1 Tax=Candidatus Poriferisocius sp. TaxID=3101276 RepID=UPI003B0231B3
MATSETATAKEWVAGLVPGTWFWGRDVPGRADVVHPVLSRLCRDRANGVWRVARGLYWRGYPQGHSRFGVRPSYRVGALLHAGPGAGLFGWSALNALSWTLQSPAKCHVSVVGKAPQPPHPTVVYHSNSNRRRESLSWAEVTILEAARWFQYGGEPWSECLEALRENASAAGAGVSALRPSMLLWASETEMGASVEARHRIEVIAGALPQEVPAQ